MLLQLKSIQDGPRNLSLNKVKIGSVSAEIFLIWTNVARTNIARTNVTVTVKSVHDGPRNLSLKIGQNHVSSS